MLPLICPNCFSANWNTKICTFCRYTDGILRDDLYLPVGHFLCHDQYRIGKVLGSPGGFGITYLAWDTRLDNKVAIKEYLPRHLASRGSGASVRPHTKNDSADFQFGMEQFLTEAKILARMKHKNIIRVLTYFEENGTAYLVMDYLEGENLSEYLTRIGNLNAPDGIQLMLPIIDSLSHIHAQGFIHRDVKPSNIYLTIDGHTILLDFGAARQALQEKSQSMTSILTPGYAPWEQYHRKGNQGPWTDVYACAAVIYQMLTGQLPVDSQERLAEDSLVPPNKINSSIPPAVSQAILHGLMLKPTDRPQTAESLGLELQASIFQLEGEAIRRPSISVKSPSIPIPNQNVSASIDSSSSKKSAVLETGFSWSAEEKRSSPFRFIALVAVIAVLAVASFGFYNYYQSSKTNKFVADAKPISHSQQIATTPTPVNVKTQPSQVTPPPSAPVKPLSLQDGKISPVPYILRDSVTLAQILNSGFGPLISSSNSRYSDGGWTREHKFNDIVISTVETVRSGEKNGPPQGSYKETIYRIKVTGTIYETARGIKIGMHKQECFNRYGTPSKNPMSSESVVLKYELRNDFYAESLYFSIDAAGIITEISVSYWATS